MTALPETNEHTDDSKSEKPNRSIESLTRGEYFAIIDDIVADGCKNTSICKV